MQDLRPFSLFLSLSLIVCRQRLGGRVKPEPHPCFLLDGMKSNQNEAYVASHGNAFSPSCTQSTQYNLCTESPQQKKIDARAEKRPAPGGPGTTVSHVESGVVSPARASDRIRIRSHNRLELCTNPAYRVIGLSVPRDTRGCQQAPRKIEIPISPTATSTDNPVNPYKKIPVRAAYLDYRK